MLRQQSSLHPCSACTTPVPPDAPELSQLPLLVLPLLIRVIICSVKGDKINIANEGKESS